MNAPINKFFRHSSHYAIGEILTFAAGFISFPILTRAFSPSDYGTMSILSVTLWICLAFSRAGLAEATVRFYREYHDSGDLAKRTTYYSTFFFATVAMTVLGFAVFALFGERILALLFKENLTDFHWIIAGLIVTGTLSMRMLNFLRAAQRTEIYNVAMVVGRYFTIFVSLGFLFWVSKTLKVYLFGNLVAEIVITACLVVLFLRRTKPSIASFSSALFKSSLAFGFPLVGMELGYLLLKSVDRYILQFMLGSEAVGVFSVASNMGHYVKDLILFPLMFALTPIYMQLWHDKGKEETSKFVSTVANMSLFLIVPIVFIFILLGKDLIIFLASDKYAEASNLLGWLVGGTMLWALLPIYASGLFIEKKTKIISMAVLIGVGVDIVLNILLIRQFGLLGSCYASLITYAVLSLIVAVISTKYLPIIIRPKSIIVSLVGSFGMCVVVLLPLQTGTLVGIIIKLSVAGIVYAGLVLGLHQDVRDFARLLAGKSLAAIRALRTR